MQQHSHKAAKSGPWGMSNIKAASTSAPNQEVQLFCRPRSNVGGSSMCTWHCGSPYAHPVMQNAGSLKYRPSQVHPLTCESSSPTANEDTAPLACPASLHFPHSCLSTSSWDCPFALPALTCVWCGPCNHTIVSCSMSLVVQ
eukprot:1151408-Pelagomonas_calceolata.AAC.7